MLIEFPKQSKTMLIVILLKQNRLEVFFIWYFQFLEWYKLGVNIYLLSILNIIYREDLNLKEIITLDKGNFTGETESINHLWKELP